MNVGFLSLLGIVFITLKLAGSIDWSWWLVLSPFLVGAVIFVIVLLLIFSSAIKGD